MRQYIDSGSVSLVILELGLALLFRAIVISSTMVGRSVTKHSTRTCVVCMGFHVGPFTPGVWWPFRATICVKMVVVCGPCSKPIPKLLAIDDSNAY
jgi:hypothetical protein